MIWTIIAVIIWAFLAMGFYQAMLDAVIEQLNRVDKNNKEKAQYGMLYGALCLVIALFPLLWLI